MDASRRRSRPANAPVAPIRFAIKEMARGMAEATVPGNEFALTSGTRCTVIKLQNHCHGKVTNLQNAATARRLASTHADAASQQEWAGRHRPTANGARGKKKGLARSAPTPFNSKLPGAGLERRQVP